jgi:SNF2 family DNA or RNA helicase
MGLGKTVQAIAACELLRRVLMVLPASLKAEWEDQIARFTDLSVAIVSGPRPDRLRQYATDAFFVLVNYQQVLIDRRGFNRIVAPDVVVLDAALDGTRRWGKAGVYNHRLHLSLLHDSSKNR